MIVDLELENKICKTCERLNVLDAFEFVRGKNPSNHLPYHNWYHIICMVEKCVEGGNYHNLPYRSLRHLAVAALFHDFAHTGGKKEDTVNIDLAISGLYTLAFIYGIDLSEVEHIIRITQYPYIAEPLSIEQKIIRDADLMQAFRPDTWKEMILTGLRQELIIKFGKDISEKEMCEGQIAFLKNMYPRSNWGKDIMYIQGQINTAIFNFSSLI
jgi:hypothetical protein